MLDLCVDWLCLDQTWLDNECFPRLSQHIAFKVCYMLLHALFNYIFLSRDKKITEVENTLTTILTWFDKNGMVANPVQFGMMFLGKKMDTKLRLSVNEEKSQRMSK